MRRSFVFAVLSGENQIGDIEVKVAVPVSPCPGGIVFDVVFVFCSDKDLDGISSRELAV